MKWEHVVGGIGFNGSPADYTSVLQKKLKTMGAEGWELTAVNEAHGYTWLFFKRPVEERDAPNITPKMYRVRENGDLVTAVRYSNAMRVAGTLPEGVTIKPFPGHPGRPPGDYPMISNRVGWGRGEIFVDEGDWIVTWEDGRRIVFDDIVFSNAFEEVKES